MTDYRGLSIVKAVLFAVAFGLYWVTTTIQNHWVSKRERKTLRDATGREPRKGEEDLLGTWLKVPTPALDDLNEQLKAAPFRRLEELATDGLTHGMPQNKTPYSKSPLEGDKKK
jgi:hypothetical protein